MSQEPILHIAIEAARAAGKLIMKATERPDTIKVMEKNQNDFVTDIDQRVEQTIINMIHKAYPNHAILGEEGGEQGEIAQADSDYLWIIDPIDGTRNFIHGFPHFAVSIAVRYKNRIEYGVIYDPCRQELFTAVRGKGAKLNDRRIRVSAEKHLAKSLLGTGFAARHQHQSMALPLFQEMLPACADIRRAGAATLDLAYVACGRLDGFFERGLHIWDIAAGILLIKEAGGMVCDVYGGEAYLTSGDVVAANPTLIRQMLKTMRPGLDISLKE